MSTPKKITEKATAKKLVVAKNVTPGQLTPLNFQPFRLVKKSTQEHGRVLSMWSDNKKPEVKNIWVLFQGEWSKNFQVVNLKDCEKA